MALSLFLISSFLSHGYGGICTDGIELWFNGLRAFPEHAYAESGSYDDSYVLWLYGSFRPRITGTHTFELWSTTYSWSSGYVSKVNFYLEGDRGTSAHT
jgi:hypothetical protein